MGLCDFLYRVFNRNYEGVNQNYREMKERDYLTLDIIRSVNEKLIKEGSHVPGHIPGRFIISCSIGLHDFRHELTRDELNAAYRNALKSAKEL